ncbi:hypothetical protein [Schlesneria paludicola]|uniref:hypothetical protein n=1 Tax=Schlesneria paludicola TaxID=360056 RepID=UPI000299D470|nr:hypothetical protein [Schlesneria paludicola]
MPKFTELACEVFDFLEDEYGFVIKETKNTRNGGHVMYVNTNKGVALEISYEFLDAFVFMFVYKLVNGEIRENSYPITEDSQITRFDFNYVLSKETEMRPAYEYGADSVFYDEENGLRNYMTESANRLRDYGSKFLRGDFSQMPLVEDAIKRRVREYNAERDRSK